MNIAHDDRLALLKRMGLKTILQTIWDMLKAGCPDVGKLESLCL